VIAHFNQAAGIVLQALLQQAEIIKVLMGFEILQPFILVWHFSRISLSDRCKVRNT